MARKHPITTYAERVLAGKVPAGALHRASCARHLADLGRKGGLRFDAEEATRAIQFFPKVLRHYKGEWAGQPITLEPWQAFIVGSLWGWRQTDGRRRFRMSFVEVPRGQGKSTIAGGLALLATFFDNEPGADGFCVAPLALDTPVPTPTGWSTLGELRVGDQVFDERGQACDVTGLSPIYHDRPCYAVEFDDGTEIVSDGEHRWLTDALKGTPHCAVRTTQEIADTLLVPWKGVRRSNHSIPAAEPLTGIAAILRVPAYTLGAWLGDGRSNRGKITVGASDSDEMRRHIEADGFETRRQHGTDTVHNFTVLGLRTDLRLMGLLDNKHVPSEYLRATRQDREALLQGLMDTDGTCTKTGECRFINERDELASAVYELAATLGATPRRGVVTVQGKRYHRVSFNPPTGLPVFRLARKRARLRARSHRVRRAIVAVRPVQSVPVRCISVNAPSHLFLVSRACIPTHNTKKDQARIVFEAARRMVLASPALRKRIEPEKHQLLQESSASRLLPLGSDADTLDGLRPHIVIADEVHAHRTADVIEIMQTGMGTRRQPMLFEITTAGSERLSVWWQHREYTRQLLEGLIEDDTWFGFIACADDEDDWQDESTWRKANPNYGVSVKPEYIAAECRKAVNLPAYEPTFRRLHLGQLVEQDTRLVSRAQWDACGEEYDWSAFVGRPVFAGLDLSKTTDLTACTWLTTDPDGSVRVWPQIWIPEAKLADHTDRVPYRTWAAQGWITVTAGNVVDYQRIRADILDKARTCQLRALGFDPWNATDTAQQLITVLGEKSVLEVRQGYASMSEPTQRLLALLAGRQLRHPQSPVLTWCADNLQVSTDPAGNVKPDKAKSRQRIDPMVALLNALHLWIRLGGEPKGSTYDTRPVLIL